jgi:hypothetical protein
MAGRLDTDWPGPRRQAFRKLMDLTSGGDAFDFFLVAMAKHKLGEKDAREWYGKAVAWMEDHNPDDKELKRFRAEAEPGLPRRSP